MLQSKPVCTPMSITTNLTLSKGTPMADPTLNRMVVGSLQYLTLTRPYISFAVNWVCQFMHSPTEDHWQTVKWILRFLKHTSNFGLLLQPTSTTRLQTFLDANRSGCTDDRRSTGGYAIFIGSNLISGHLASNELWLGHLLNLNTKL